MAGPPMDIPASELWQKLMETPRPSEVVDFPRRDAHGNPIGRLRMQVLTLDDHDRARIQAQSWLKRQNMSREDMEGPAIREVLGDRIARELIAMSALTESGPDDGNGNPMYGRVFKDADALGKLGADEIAILFNYYQTIQHKYGPYERTVTSPEELNAWIKRLAEGASEFPLLQLPLPRLVELTCELAKRAYSLSSLLDSLWSSLPDTYKSQLEGCSMGIGYYGAQPASATESDTGE